MAKKKVCISYDHENDKLYRYLLAAWDKNQSFEFTFNDKTPGEINSNNIGRIKAVLTKRISESTYLLVIIGKHMNQRHKDYKLIGDINWVNWEINKAKSLGKKLIGVKIDRSNDSPIALMNSGASWALSFSQEAIISAIK